MRTATAIESPLEHIFLCGMRTLKDLFELRDQSLLIFDGEDPCRWVSEGGIITARKAEEVHRGSDGIVAIYPQCQIGDYRADFMLVSYSLAHDASPLVVECDGVTYHRYPVDDFRRDRTILATWGIPTIRFSTECLLNEPHLVLQTTIEALDAALEGKRL